MTQGENFAEVTQWLSNHSIVIGTEPIVSGLVRIKNEKFSFETSITTNNGGAIKHHYSNSPTLSIGPGLGVVLLMYPNSPRYSLFTTNINGGIYDTGERLWNLMGKSSRTALFAQKIFPDERKSKIETWS